MENRIRIPERRFKKKDLEYLALLDKVREYREYLDRQPEYQEFQKKLEVVLRNLRTKRDDLKGKGKDIRVGLLAFGGGEGGCYGAGQMAALEDSGYSETFTAAVGTSSGACDIAYFLAHQALLGATVFYKECMTGSFFNPRRLRKIVDADFLTGIFRSGSKKLNVQAIRDNPTKFYVQVLNIQTGECELKDTKGEVDIIKLLHASMALPLVYNKQVKINGSDYVDAAFRGLSIQKVIKLFGLTDVLILPQRAYEPMENVKKKAQTYSRIAKLIPDDGPLAIFDRYFKYSEVFHEILAYIREESEVNIGIMYPPAIRDIKAFGNRPEDVQTAVWASAIGTFKDLREGRGENFRPIHLYSDVVPRLGT